MSIADRLAAKEKQEIAISTPLSKQELKDWQRLREEVSANQEAAASFIECLAEIRDRRLYRDEYATFDAYVAAELSFSKRHIDRIIHHNEVKTILGPTGPKLPERQSRELTNVPPEKMAEVIEKADAKAGSEGGKRAARHVKQAAAEVVGENVEPEPSPTPETERECLHDAIRGLEADVGRLVRKLKTVGLLNPVAKSAIEILKGVLIRAKKK